MNALTRQETSIVDSTPGTTADVKVSLLELHDIGPCKLFDTAGIDEEGEMRGGRRGGEGGEGGGGRRLRRGGRMTAG
jgi:predicted GTPase